MKSALATVGIESYYTLIYGDSKPIKIDQRIPSQQFNHVILCVPLEQDTVWLENTSSSSPFNYLGVFTQNRKGLLVNGDKSELVNTPALTQEQCLIESKFGFSLDTDNTLIISKSVNGMNDFIVFS